MPARAEGPGVEVVAQVGGQERLAGWHHARRAGGKIADQLRFGGGDPLHRSEQLQVHRPDVHNHADVRLGDRGQFRDLALTAHGHLEDEGLRARRRLEDGERSRC